LAGNVAITSTNRAALRMVTVRIVGDASQRTLTLGEAGKWIGAAKPTALAAGKIAVLSLTAFGSAESDVIAAYAADTHSSFLSPHSSPRPPTATARTSAMTPPSTTSPAPLPPTAIPPASRF
jgi:hypothetical protein